MQQRNSIGLAIVVSHPIQYYSPIFKLLSQKVKLKVFYTRPGSTNYDIGFRNTVQWDIPLLEGYEYKFARGTELIKNIKEFNPNQLLIYGWAHYSHLKLLLFFNKNVTVNFRGDSNLLVDTCIWRRVLKKLVLTWIYKRIDFAFYVGTCNKSYFMEYGLKEEQLCFAPHSVDNDRFSSPGSKSALRSNLGLLETSILILYAGKFDHNKNPELLLRAFTELNLPNVYLLFTGSGLLEKKLRLKSANVENVRFLPFQNQSAMPALYQACDLFCLPTRSDSWGLSINEAMAAGKAILVSDKAGAAHDLITKENGRLFKSNNLPDLKRKLLELTTCRSQLQNAGNHSFRIIQGWSNEIQINNMIKCLCTNI
jgi:glycosyltransferase involved in cell wall biosynthesis